MNILEKGGQPNAEQPKNSSELYWKKLTAMPETSGALRKTLSGDNVKEYMRIMTSPQAVEGYWLAMCGDLTYEQAAQYMVATDAYYETLQKLTELALKISQEFKPRLVELVKKDVRGEKKAGIYNLFLSFLELREARFQPIKNLFLGSETMSDQFLMQISSLIGSDLIDIMEDYSMDENIRNEIKEFISGYVQYHNIEFAGTYYHDEKNNFKKAFENQENLKNLDKMTGFSEEYSHDERSKINEKNETIFADIKKEALYKKIPLITLNDQEPQIIAIRENPVSIGNYAPLCAVRLNFNKEKIGFPPAKMSPQGQLTCDYGKWSNVVNFNINPATGDLCFVSSGIPLDQIIPGDRYLALKHYILLKLKDYLESKEPDIEDLFAYSPSELEAREKKIEIEEKAKQLEEAPAELMESAKMPVKVEKIPEEKLSLPKSIRVMIMDTIRGAKAEEIIAALRRMLGKEERTRGSHLFFRSDRNGRILPVPRHSQKDEHHMALPLVLHNLNIWGYDAVELAVELGLKIPKKSSVNDK